MGEFLQGVLMGGVGAAVVSSIGTIFVYKIKRRDAKEDQEDTIKKALRYVMLYIIQERCKYHISAGKITMQERRALRHWHELYHDGLGGNGDADLLMRQVEEIETDIEN